MSKENLIIIPNNLPQDLQQTLLRMKNKLDNLASAPVQVSTMAAPQAAASAKVSSLTFGNVRFVGRITGRVDAQDILAYVYPNITSALASIGDNTITNQYVILVFPGTYLEDFTCKDYVHILGTGENVIIEAQTYGGIVGATSSITNVSLTQLSSISDTTTTNFGASQSCSIYSGAPNTNYHDSSTSAGYLDGTPNTQHPLLRFDFSSIPSGATITAATLYISVYRGVSNLGGTLSYYNVLRDFVDTQATWNSYITGQTWTTAGCNGVGTDRENISLTKAILLYGTGETWESKDYITKIDALVSGTAKGIRLSWSYGDYFRDILIRPEGHANEPYMAVTYTGGGAPIVSIPAGKTTDLHEVVFKGVTGGLLTTGVSVAATATAHISSCKFDSAIRRGVNNSGTVYSMGNIYKTVLYDLINTGTAFYTAGDCYMTSSGTITPRGNADMLDGYHATNATGGIPVSNGTVNTNLNADMTDGFHLSYDSDLGTFQITG